MSVRTSARSVWSTATPAVTVTVSVTCPTSRPALTRMTLSSATLTPVVTFSLNPEIATRTEYVPGGSVANVAVPISLETPVLVRPVSVWVTVTSAPGTAPPLWSRTSTSTDPYLTWASARDTMPHTVNTITPTNTAALLIVRAPETLGHRLAYERSGIPN